MKANYEKEFPVNEDADLNTGITGMITIQDIPVLESNTSGTTSGYTMIILNEDNANVTSQCTFNIERISGTGSDLYITSGTIYTLDTGEFEITATHSDYNVTTNPGAKDTITVTVQ